MSTGIVSYIVALAGLGIASGLDIMAQRRFFSLGGAAHAIASVSGLADIALIVVAFFLFPAATAITAILIGGICTAIVATALPPAPGWVWITALVGAIAAIVHFAG